METFVLYTSYYDILDDLSLEDLGHIFKAILYYKKNQEILELPKHLLTTFKFIKNQLDLDAEKYSQKIEKLKANGSKGGRPKKENEEEKPNGFQEEPQKPKVFFKNHNVNVNDNDNVNDNVSFSYEKEREKSKTKKIEPYSNPIKTFFVDEYKSVFQTKPFLSARDCNRLVELAADNPDIKEVIPIAISRLKEIEFRDIDFKPSASWLLKGNNFERVMNGEFKRQETQEEKFIRKAFDNG